MLTMDVKLSSTKRYNGRKVLAGILTEAALNLDGLIVIEVSNRAEILHESN
jgi:hypothetical protein